MLHRISPRIPFLRHLSLKIIWTTLHVDLRPRAPPKPQSQHQQQSIFRKWRPNVNIKKTEHLSSGYGSRLMFQRSWVRIRILDGHFFTFFVVKLKCVFEKTKINEKEAVVGPFLKNFMQSLHGHTTGQSGSRWIELGGVLKKLTWTIFWDGNCLSGRLRRRLESQKLPDLLLLVLVGGCDDALL